MNIDESYNDTKALVRASLACDVWVGVEGFEVSDIARASNKWDAIGAHDIAEQVASVAHFHTGLSML